MVYITDAAGLSTTSTVTATVSQVLTSVAESPALASLTAGQTQQFSATGYDQFGLSMSPQPSFSWALLSGGGSLSATGLYTSPGTGTEAVVQATTGTFTATGTADVVSAPWSSVDIGSPGIGGGAFDLSGTVTIRA
jgi:hypothetical protein